MAAGKVLRQQGKDDLRNKMVELAISHPHLTKGEIEKKAKAILKRLSRKQ